MKLKTVWTMDAMSLRERLNRTGQIVLQKIAHHLPRKLAYWSYIDTGARYIGPKDVVPQILYMDILERFWNACQKET